MSHVNDLEPLTLNQAAEAAGLSRSTIKRRLKELEKAGAYRLPSGQWRIPRTALSVLVEGARGSGPVESRAPRRVPSDPSSAVPRDPREPLQEQRVGDELVEARRALTQARIEAAEWRARAEERAHRITELATRAEAAEARLDRMITSQTALALTLKEQHQLAGASAASPDTPAPGATPTSMSTGVGSSTAPEGRRGSSTLVAKPAIGQRFHAWRTNRRTR